MKKFLSTLCAFLSCSAYAQNLTTTSLPILNVVTVDEINGASNALVEKIKEDPSHFHFVSYSDLALVPGSVGDIAGNVTLDPNGHLSQIHISSVSFTAEGVPFVKKYGATLDLTGNVTAACTLNPEGRQYKILKSTSVFINGLFDKDLTGNHFAAGKEAYGDVVFNYLLTHSQKLRSYCATGTWG